MGERKSTILNHSSEIATMLGITLTNNEYKLGEWGRADNHVWLTKNLLFLIEIEKSQRHPEMNVLKVWPYLEKNTQLKIILVQHIISEDSVSPNRIRISKWLDIKMASELGSRFNYHLLVNSIKDEEITAIKNSIANFIK